MFKIRGRDLLGLYARPLTGTGQPWEQRRGAPS